MTSSSATSKPARRTTLIVPIRERTIEKAPTTEADVIMLDLDDGIPYTTEAKDAGRALLVAALRRLDFGTKEVLVRINSLDTPWWQDDLRALADAPIRAFVPPKVDTAADVRHVETIMLAAGANSQRLWPMIETTAAIENCAEIATSSARIEALLFGVGDYTVTTHGEFWDNDLNHLAYPLGKVLCVGRTHGLSVIAPTVVFSDMSRLDLIKAQAVQLRRMGYDGAEIMYPGHLATANEVFTPNEEQIAWALKLEAAIGAAHKQGQSAAVVDGKLVEIVSLKLAEQTLEVARALHLAPDA